MMSRLKLWQKIFIISTFSVLITQILSLGWYLFTYNQKQRIMNMLEFVTAKAEKVKNLPDAEFLTFIDLYDVGYRRVWLEDPAGRVLMGQPSEGMALADRGGDKVAKRYEFNGALALVLKKPEPAVMAIVDIERGGKPAKICFNWQRGVVVIHWGVFIQGVLGLIGLSLILSRWTAKKVSRPLNELCGQVMRIASGDGDIKLGDGGLDDVASLSKAIKALTDSLNERIASLKRLMANLSHEIRSSVTGLSMSLDNLDDAVRPLQGLQAPIGRLGRLIDNLEHAKMEMELLENMLASGILGWKLDFRPDDLNLAPFDFSSLCGQIVSKYAYWASIRGLALESRIEGDLWLMGDEALLGLLLNNILDNAMKYTETGGAIVFGLSSSQDGLTVKCLNSHAPLSENELQSLPLPYFRAESGKADGSGLGLHLVDRIVGLHKGRLAIGNHHGGLLVSIDLPVPEGPAKLATVL